jgi:MFS family permease
VAGLVSNIGSAMHGVAAAWVVTEVTRSPAVVSLLAAATALPSFLLALPAGALADVVDRRRMMLLAQTQMLVVAAVLAAADFSGGLGTGLLIVLTMALSVGGTLNMPNWVALAPELLPRDQLASAGALNAVSMNIAGAAGPTPGRAGCSWSTPSASWR